MLLSVAAPTGLVGARVTGTSVGLFWADNSNEDHFVVERSATAATGPFTVLNSAVAQNATTFSDTTAAAGTTYYYRVKATKTGDADSSYSNVIAVTPSVLPGVPSTWSTLDVGSIPSNGPGSGSETGGTFTLSSQAGDIGNQPDAFRFVYRDITGDFSIVAKVVSENSTKDWAKAGLMIRESTAPGSGASPVRTAAFVTTPYALGRQQLQFEYVTGWANYDYPYSQSTGTFHPIWLKLTRTGNQIDARYSLDGTTWPASPSSSGTIAGLASTLKVGLVVSANQVNLNNTAQFAEVSGVGPEGVLAAAASATSVNLAWTDHTTNETGFVVERSPNGTSGWTQVGSTLAANTTTSTDTSASASTTYYYRVKAVGPDVYSPASAAVTTPAPPTPAAPSGVTATDVDSTTVQLSWTDNSDNETMFRIEYSSDGGQTWGIYGEAPANLTTLPIWGNNPATHYLYRVIAVNAAGDSLPSNTASAMTPLTTVAATANNRAHHVLVTWEDAHGETGYTIWRRNVTAGGSFALVATLPPDVTRFDDGGTAAPGNILAEDTTYAYYVIATDSAPAGNSVPSNTASATTAAFQAFHDDWPYLGYVTAGVPEMTAAGIQHIYTTNTTIFNGDGSANNTNIAAAVDKAYHQGDHIFVFDTEGLLEDIRNPWAQSLEQSKATVRATLDQMKQAVCSARTALAVLDANYEMKFGFWNDFSLAGPTDTTRPELVQKWHEAVDFLMGIDGNSYDQTHDIRKFVDFVTTGLYTSTDMNEWSRYAQSVLQETARYGLPVYAWLDPQFLGSPLYGRVLSFDQWRQELELVRQAADGLDIWGWAGNPTQYVQWSGYWSANEQWWEATQTFLGQPASIGAPRAPTLHNPAVGPGPRLTWDAPAVDDNHAAAQGYIIEKQGPGGGWEVVGGTRDTTWSDPQVHVGPAYAYRVKAFNAFGTSETVATTAAAAQRDAFEYTPATTNDARQLAPRNPWPNHDGEDTRVVFAAADEYVEYDGVVFSAQPTRLELDLAVHDSGAGGVLEAWIGATTTAAGGYMIGTLTTQGTGSTDLAYGTYVPQEMLIKHGVTLNTPLTLYIIDRSIGANFHGFRFYTAQRAEDATTGGAGWQAKYGAEGKWIELDQTNTALPGADLTIDPTASVWDWGSGHAGALRRASGTGFVEGTLYKSSPFYVDVAFHGSGLHKLTAYFFQPDGAGRVQQVDLLTQSTTGGGAYDVVLDSKTISNFDNGLFLSWVVGGNVRIRVTPISGVNAVMSAVFVDSIGQFVGTDATTQGNWKGTYGSEFASHGEQASTPPSYLSFAWENPGVYSPHWFFQPDNPDDKNVAPLTDPRYLLDINGTGQQRSPLYSHWPFSPGVFSMNLTDGKLHKMSLYFNEPQISTFVAADKDTHGNWPGAYGGAAAASHYIPGVQTPANVTFVGAAPTLRSLSSGADLENVKYLRNPLNMTTRTDTVASWSGNTAEIHVDLPLNEFRELALYFVSDDPSLSQDVQLFDPRGRMIDHQVVSDFGSGKYLVWDVAGPVTIKLVHQGGSTPGVVLGGILFDQNKSFRPAMQVEIFNADTNELLDSRKIDWFQLGKYASWNVSGHVRVQILTLYQTETRIEGIFLDPVGS